MIRDLSYIDVGYLIYAGRGTVGLTVLALLGGAPIGLLIAVMARSPGKVTRAMAHCYLTVVQGIPLLGLLFLVFFGLSVGGIQVGPVFAASVGFSLYSSAYLGEIWYGSLISVPKGQWEAATSIGLSGIERYRYVIIPHKLPGSPFRQPLVSSFN